MNEQIFITINLLKSKLKHNKAASGSNKELILFNKQSKITDTQNTTTRAET